MADSASQGPICEQAVLSEPLLSCKAQRSTVRTPKKMNPADRPVILKEGDHCGTVTLYYTVMCGSLVNPTTLVATGPCPRDCVKV